MGDDADAPHELTLNIDRNETLEGVLSHLLEIHYLPGIMGGKATWIVESGTRALAVIAQQWTHPRFLLSGSLSIDSSVAHTGPWHLNFKYWCQADPDLVFQSLRDGNAPPDKYGRK